jgi:hypothetical protein
MGRLDAFITAEADGASWQVEVEVDQDKIRWFEIRDVLSERFDAVRDARLESISGQPASDWELSSVTFDDVAPEDASSESETEALAMLAVVVFGASLLGGMAGAMYPAIDAVLGERDRGAIESTLMLPVARWQLALSKVLAVSVSVLLSSLGHMAGVFLLMVQLLASTESGLELPAMSAWVALGGIPVLLLSSVCAAAWLLLWVLPAKEFAVAEAMVSGGFTLAMVAVMHGFAHLADTEGPVGWVPWSSAMRLGARAISGQATWPDLWPVLLVHTLFLVGMVGVGAWWFGRESFVFGVTSGGPEDKAEGEDPT